MDPSGNGPAGHLSFGSVGRNIGMVQAVDEQRRLDGVLLRSPGCLHLREGTLNRGSTTHDGLRGTGLYVHMVQQDFGADRHEAKAADQFGATAQPSANGSADQAVTKLREKG